MSLSSIPLFASLSTVNYYTWKENVQAAIDVRGLWHAVAEDAVYRGLVTPVEKDSMSAKARAVIVYDCSSCDLAGWITHALM